MNDNIFEQINNIKNDISNVKVFKKQRTLCIVHKNVFCNICMKNIVGKRFKCMVCENFDICEVCEDNPKLTYHYHPLIRFMQIVDTKKVEETIDLFRLRYNLAKLNDSQLKFKIVQNLTGNAYPDNFYSSMVKDYKNQSLGEFIFEMIKIFE